VTTLFPYYTAQSAEVVVLFLVVPGLCRCCDVERRPRDGKQVLSDGVKGKRGRVTIRLAVNEVASFRPVVSHTRDERIPDLFM